MSKHTPTPWKRGKYPGDIEDANGKSLALAIGRAGEQFMIQRPCVDDRQEGEANAEFIVRACNLHDELVELVKYVIDNGTCYRSAIEMTGPVGVDFEEWGARAITTLSKLEGK